MSKPLGVIYFTSDKTDLAKDMAAAVRAEGNLANLVFAHLFRGVEDCVGCHAVIIQQSYSRHAQIVQAYREFNPEAEIHLYTDEGEFVVPSDIPEEKPFTLPGANQEQEDAGQAIPADSSDEVEAVTEDTPTAEAVDGSESEEGGGDGEDPAITQ